MQKPTKALLRRLKVELLELVLDSVSRGLDTTRGAADLIAINGLGLRIIGMEKEVLGV